MNHLSVIPSFCGCLSAAAMLRRLCGSPVEQSRFTTPMPSETTVQPPTVVQEPAEDGLSHRSSCTRCAQIRFWISLATRLPRADGRVICIYGGGVSLGYIGDHAEETALFERQPDGSMHRSGDLAISCRMATLHSCTARTTRS